MQLDSRYLATGLFCLGVKSTGFNFIILRRTNVRRCGVRRRDSPRKRIAQQRSCTAVEKQMCACSWYTCRCTPVHDGCTVTVRGQRVP